MKIVKFNILDGVDLCFDNKPVNHRCSTCEFNNRERTNSICSICIQRNEYLNRPHSYTLNRGHYIMRSAQRRPTQLETPDNKYRTKFAIKEDNVDFCKLCDLKDLCGQNNKKYCEEVITDSKFTVYFKNMKEDIKTNDELDIRASEVAKFVLQNENLMTIITNENDENFERFCNRFKEMVKLFI